VIKRNEIRRAGQLKIVDAATFRVNIFASEASALAITYIGARNLGLEF
jgi:hypothetical protein